MILSKVPNKNDTWLIERLGVILEFLTQVGKYNKTCTLSMIESYGMKNRILSLFDLSHIF